MFFRRPLVSLNPEWLSTGKPRYQMGIEFDCPRHSALDGRACRLRLWFQNPADGEAPAPPGVVDGELYPRRVFRIGGPIDHLTLTPVGADTGHPIDVYQHWRGYVHDGVVIDAVTVGGVP